MWTANGLEKYRDSELEATSTHQGRLCELQVSRGIEALRGIIYQSLIRRTGNYPSSEILFGFLIGSVNRYCGSGYNLGC